jgi:arsenate reductase (thioredoxin)
MNKPKVLFLDQGNCSGSQMAEGYLRYLAGDLFEAFSAGIEPHELSPIAVLVMDEVGIDISRHYCKNVEEYVTFHFTYVITLCQLAFGRCPVFHSAEHFQHWDFRDAPPLQGSFQEEPEAFRDLRRLIEHRVWEFISHNSLSLSGGNVVKQ